MIVGITSYGLNNPGLLDLTIRCIDSVFFSGLEVFNKVTRENNEKGRPWYFGLGESWWYGLTEEQARQRIVRDGVDLGVEVIVINDISVGGDSKTIYQIGGQKGWDISRLTIIDVKYNNLSRSWNDICRLVFHEKNLDRILILNNDLTLEKDSLKRLIEFSKQNPNIGMIYGLNDLMFSAFLIRKDLYEKVGKFDENLPFYYNDWDYLERCRLVGQEPFYFHDFKLLHERSKTRQEVDSTEMWKKICNDSLSYYRNKWKDKGVRLP